MSRNYRWIVTDPGVWQKVLPELMAAGRQTQELQDMVVITSLAETALDCRRLGIFCVGYDPDRSGLYFPGVSLVTEDPEALDEEELDRERRRFHHLPVYVASSPRLKLREGLPRDYAVLRDMVYGPGGQMAPGWLRGDLLEHPDNWNTYVSTAYALFGTGYYVAEAADGVILSGSGDIVSGRIASGSLSYPGIIGLCGFAPGGGNENAELGYVVKKELRRNGFGMEMCRAVLVFAAENGISRATVRIPEGNAASRKLAEALQRELDVEILSCKE